MSGLIAESRSAVSIAVKEAEQAAARRVTALQSQLDAANARVAKVCGRVSNFLGFVIAGVVRAQSSVRCRVDAAELQLEQDLAASASTAAMTSQQWEAEKQLLTQQVARYAQDLDAAKRCVTLRQCM